MPRFTVFYDMEKIYYNLGFTNSLNFIRLLRIVITPSVTTLLRGQNDSKQSDEFQASLQNEIKQ